MNGQKIFFHLIQNMIKINMINKILDIIIDISNSIYIWAWRKKYSRSRMDRYKKFKNKKIW
jgi:hypothetical protein